MFRKLSTSIKNRRSKSEKEKLPVASSSASSAAVDTKETKDINNLAAHGNVPHDVNGTTPTKPDRRKSWLTRSKTVPTVPEAEDDEIEGGPVAEGEDHPEEDDNVFHAFASVLHASQRPLPTQTGDGTYIDKEPTSSTLEDLKHLGFKDYKTLLQVLQQKASGALVDDKSYIMERVIQLVSGLPAHSQKRVDLTNAFVDELWTSLQHPPLSYLGDKFTYRQADGSYNNILYPHLGAANTPYARTVQPITVQPGALPDPGLIFDSVFARTKFRKHSNNNSSIIFYWASLIIHDLFQTDHRDFSNSQTSSYLDLSTLYGDVQSDQDQIRTFKEGKLKPDCFSEERMLGFPPGCGVLLIMFNRFHNYVVEQLAIINENGRFTKPSDKLPEEMAKKAWEKYDNDLFQTGRLITCGLYMNITLLDYLRTIVNLNRSNTTWTLDPRVDMHGKGTPRGTGNQVSAEFNLVYRWHSAVSERDEAWTENMYQEMFGKPADEVSLPELLGGLNKWAKSLSPDPHKRPFAGLERQADGKYKDDDLVDIMVASIEDVAGASGANHVPKALKAVEILGMIQARKWGLATLNEFRKFFGLNPHETFESINKDPEVAENLRRLYEHPDFVEMYPGLVCEEAKTPMVPGVGIAPTFTVSRAILSDAVCLVRGDRFYTIDYHAKNLTNWGYNEVAYDLNIESGCVFYKLFLRAFPNHFQTNSVYAHYPMTIPAENKRILRALGRESHYTWEKPRFIEPRVNLTSYPGAKYVLERQHDFTVTWGKTTEEVYGPYGARFMLSGDDKIHTTQRETMSKVLYRDNWHADVKKFYEHITLQLLHRKSFKIAGINHVDITRDVGNLAHVHFASTMFDLPLKWEENPSGIFSEHEMYMGLAVIFTCIFFDLEPTKSFPLHQAAKAVAKKLGKLIEANVKSVAATGFVSGIADKFRGNKGYLTEYGIHMIRRLLESGLTAEETAWSQVFPTATAMVPNQSQVFTQCLDYYLSDAGKKHLPDIHKLAKENTPEADEKLTHYVMEGIRLNGTFGSYRESQVNATIDDKGKPVTVKPGDKVFVSFVGAARDADVFPSPDEVKLDRSLDSYIHYGIGPHTCLGRDASRVALTAMLKVVGGLDNLRRAPGPKGELKKIPRPGGFYVYMREDHGSYFPFPLTMQVNWDVLQKVVDTCDDLSAQGSIDACKAITQFTGTQQNQCRKPSSLNETVTGYLPELPGCNPVFAGPGPAPKPSCPGKTLATIGSASNYFTDVTSSGWAFQGCATDGNPRTLTDKTTLYSAGVGDTMTVDKCMTYCAGYTYAGLEYAGECYCGNNLAAGRAPVSGILGQSNMKCKGNSNQFCGGPSAFSLYKKCTGSTCQNVPFSGSSSGSSSPVQNAASSVTPPKAASSSSIKAASPSLPVKVVSAIPGTSLKTSTRSFTSIKAASPAVSPAVKASSVPVSVIYVTVTHTVSTCGRNAKREVR